jgi:hypothetical protein
MSMTTMLTLTAMFGAVRQNVPKVSYISLLDVWMVICILFVFACIVEFTVVSSLLKNGNKEASERTEIACRFAIPLAFFIFNSIYWPLLFLGG